MLLPLVLFVGLAQFEFIGDCSLSQVVDQIQKSVSRQIELDVTEQIPESARKDLNIRAKDVKSLFNYLESQTPIRFIRPRDGRKYQLVWSDGAPAKGKVRVYMNQSGFVLEANTASIRNIASTIETRLYQYLKSEDEPKYDINVVREFTDANLPFDSIIASFKTSAYTGVKPETMPAFIKRLISELAKANQQPKSQNVRSIWNLTFLAGSPPNIDSGDKIDFSKVASSNLSATDLAKALNDAYTPTSSAGTAATAEVKVSAIGPRTLMIDGKDELVSHIRRLLATQIDVPQSQLLLELDTYLVSADMKGRIDANRRVNYLMAAQDIARAYKHTYYITIQEMLANLHQEISEEICDKNPYAINNLDLFRLCGLDPNSGRQLSQTDMLVFLAYCPDELLISQYPLYLMERFKQVHQAIKMELGIGKKKQNNSVEQAPPTADPQKLQAETLGILNDAIYAQVKKLTERTSNVLTSFTDNNTSRASRILNRHITENEMTRSNVEEFLILWLATSDARLHGELKKADRSGQDSDSKEQKDTSVSQQSRTAAKSSYPLADAFLKTLVKDDETISRSKKGMDALEDVLRGDRTIKLTRVGARLDDLVAIGVRALQADSAFLIDAPLDQWINSAVITNNRSSRFGVSYGGSTKLSVTSRVPGVIGSQMDSFFPYQPTSPLDLKTLIPVLSRNPGTFINEKDGKKSLDGSIAGELTKEAGLLVAGGASFLEMAALQAIFDQASMLPYDRKLGSGINFSVLPTVLPSGGTARLQIKLSLSLSPDEANAGKTRAKDTPGPIDLLKSTVVETEVLVNAFDIALISSMKLDVSAPAKRDWEVPILSQILPIRSWFVGPTQDKTVRHEALVLMKVTIVPRAMDIASRTLDSN